MSKSAKNDIMVAISVPPFWHCGRTIRGNSLYTLIALAPAMLVAFAMWGIPAIRVVALSVFTAMACEYLCQKAMGQRPSQTDGTAAVLGVQTNEQMAQNCELFENVRKLSPAQMEMLHDAFAKIDKGEIFVYNINISSCISSAQATVCSNIIRSLGYFV